MDYSQDINDLQTKLRVHFYKFNQNLYNEISEAVKLNDMKLAHRLAHTLKGNAGMIEKAELRQIAAEIEASLNNEIIPSSGQMSQLKSQLTRVLEELKPPPDPSQETIPQPLDTRQIQVLFEKIEPMLKNINPESVNYLDELRAVPGGEELACQVESYDFKAAAETLAKLKMKWM